MEDYKTKYEKLIQRIDDLTVNGLIDKTVGKGILKDFTVENDDEKIRKALIKSFEINDLKALIIPGFSAKDVIAWLEKVGEPQDKGEISDGYHTFNELYYYRMLYNAAFFNILPKEWVHKSKKHHDGEECFGGGWFIVMANLPTGQISNHYELKDWDLFQIPEKEVADKWDGHTPQEAAERLHKYLLEKQDEQKLTWSEEGEKNFNTILNLIRDSDLSAQSANKLSSWLKSLRPQLLRSEEDEQMIIDSIKYLELFDAQGIHGDKALPCINWLKSLKERVQPQLKQEWSEKDERMFDRLRKHFDWGSGYYFNRNDCDEADDWLISLKERIKGE